MPDGPSAAADVLAGLARRVVGVVLPTQLERLVLAAAPVLHVTGVAMMLLDRSGSLRPVGSSDAPSEALEYAQADLGSGPALDAIQAEQAVSVDDLAGDLRYGPLADWLAGAGVRTVASVLSVPVLVLGEAVGGLDAYRDRPGPWTERDRLAVATVADLVGLMLRLGADGQQRTARSPAQDAGGAP